MGNISPWQFYFLNYITLSRVFSRIQKMRKWIIGIDEVGRGL
ncbi:MAG: hypothetical protein Q7R98_00320 [Candidatus Jorgensenbacteria bacterium]|nr:hypothetical protein [Candidatus Jorgensenbacteria bacterium]